MGDTKKTALNASSRLNSSFIFPFHKIQTSCFSNISQSPENNYNSALLCRLSTFSRQLLFKSVSAAEKEEAVEDDKQDPKDMALEMLARAYISQEPGWDRVKAIFLKDHRGKNNMERDYITISLVQVCVISFFMKYIPAIKFARQEFIREHQATVFRTRIEAVRRMQDHIFIKAAMEGASFSTKMTLFSASFLLISQMIAAYRNKTSVLEYTIAAGITGGLARIGMGFHGLISGTIVGTVLGSAIGTLGWAALTTYGIAQEDRHLLAIKDKLEVERSLEGDTEFQKKINDLKQEIEKTALQAETSS